MPTDEENERAMVREMDRRTRRPEAVADPLSVGRRRLLRVLKNRALDQLKAERSAEWRQLVESLRLKG